MPQIQLLPEQASTMAPRVDALYYFLIAIAAFFMLLVAGVVIYFAFKYRRRTRSEVGAPIHGSLGLEITWTVIPLLIVLVIFGWSASIFFSMASPPSQTLDVYVVGKQWMWKFQHPDGHQEINELHVPVGVNVKLTMTSQDVVHDVYIPDFRLKADVLPGKYTHMWFKATKPGKYHLFCAQYCGTSHSGMVGWVIVQERADFQRWLTGGGGLGATMAQSGEKLFRDLACSSCHQAGSTGRGPTLIGLFGSKVTLDTGATATADEAYLRESITNPRAKVVMGFQPIMPSFQGLVSEEGMLQLLEYIKSLQTAPSNATGAVPAAAPAAARAPGTPVKK